VILKNIARQNTQEVINPKATVLIMALGMIFSGHLTSSAICVAASRQTKSQFGLINPKRKASPLDDQPVEFVKVANTNLGSL